MIQLDPRLNVYVYYDAVDMRKSIDGLICIVVEKMRLNPQEKALFLFRNKSADKIKAIVWDKQGFIMIYKRMEKTRFRFPKLSNKTYYEIDTDLFDWLLKGFDFYAIKEYPELKTSVYY